MIRPREEHLAWCKARALAYLDENKPVEAVTSMMSDMQTHPETKFAAGSILFQLGLFATMSANSDEVRRYIAGFN